MFPTELQRRQAAFDFLQRQARAADTARLSLGDMSAGVFSASHSSF